MAYHWPGNVRELANAIERATLLADGAELDVEIPESPGGQDPAASGGAATGQTTRDVLLDLTLEQLQRLHITHALEASDYAVFGPHGAAKRLDINPTTLLSRMDKFGIPRPRLSKPTRAESTSRRGQNAPGGDANA
jgi:DNA-binding NtrC family response regulator